MIAPRLTTLNYNEILMYLGHRGQEIPTEIEEQIEACIDQVMSCAKPRLTYRILPVVGGQAEGFPLPGEDMKSLMKNGTQVILLGATLGPEVDRLLQRAEVRNMADALIMDACASTAIENVCNNFCLDIETQWSEIIDVGAKNDETDGGNDIETRATRKVYFSDRFSPGYGDLPLETQKLFCEKLEMGKRIGVHLSASSLMIPRKSVTAIIAVSDQPMTHRRHGCETCNMFRTCQFRRSGHSCYTES